MEGRVKKSLWSITVIAAFLNLDQITCYTLSILIDGATETQSSRLWWSPPPLSEDFLLKTFSRHFTPIVKISTQN